MWAAQPDLGVQVTRFHNPAPMYIPLVLDAHGTFGDIGAIWDSGF
jgi:hypothetical protein